METNPDFHSKLATLVELWQTKRGIRTMPRRADFDPVALREWLGNLVLIDVVDAGQDFRVRLHGSKLSWATSDMTGKSAMKLLSDWAGAVTADCGRVVTTKAPLFTRYRQTISGRPTNFVAVILPLSDDGFTVTMALLAAYPSPE